MDAGLSTSQLWDTGLQARDVHTNVSEDRAADFLLEVRIISKLRGGSSKTISAGHLSQVLILAIGRGNKLAVDALKPSIAIDRVGRCRHDHDSEDGGQV